MTENTIGLDKDCVLDWNLDENGCLMVYGSGNNNGDRNKGV